MDKPVRTRSTYVSLAGKLGLVTYTAWVGEAWLWPTGTGRTPAGRRRSRSRGSGRRSSGPAWRGWMMVSSYFTLSDSRNGFEVSIGLEDTCCHGHLAYGDMNLFCTCAPVESAEDVTGATTTSPTWEPLSFFSPASWFSTYFCHLESLRINAHHVTTSPNALAYPFQIRCRSCVYPCETSISTVIVSFKKQGLET